MLETDSHFSPPPAAPKALFTQDNLGLLKIPYCDSYTEENSLLNISSFKLYSQDTEIYSLSILFFLKETILAGSSQSALAIGTGLISYIKFLHIKDALLTTCPWMWPASLTVLYLTKPTNHMASGGLNSQVTFPAPTRWLRTTCTSSSGCPFWLSWALHTCGAHTDMQANTAHMK